MAAAASPSKLVSSTNLSLSNSSPWRLKVTVEAQPDAPNAPADLFLDLAHEESQSSATNISLSKNPPRRGRKSKDRSITTALSATTTSNEPAPAPAASKPRHQSILSDDSLGLDNDATGIFTSDFKAVAWDSTPKRRVSTGARGAATSIVVPLKGSEPKQKPPRRKGTPGRKRTQDIDLAADTPRTQSADTPRRRRGRPRKSLPADTTISTVANETRNPSPPRADPVEEDNMDVDMDDTHHPALPDDTFQTQMPSPPSSPIPRLQPRAAADANDESIVASEEFSMIAPPAATSMRPMVGLNTPRPTPDAEDPQPPEPAEPVPQSQPECGPTETHADQSNPQSAHAGAVEQMADHVAALSLQTGPKRRRSLRISAQPAQEAQSMNNAAPAVKDRFRELASKPSQPATTSTQPPEPVGDASSFRRFLQREPAKLVPGTYDESAAYFAPRRGRPPVAQRKQTPAKPTRRVVVEPVEHDFENIIPEHLLAPIQSAQARTELESTPDTPDDNPFWEEGRSVRWHEDVAGGSFSLNSSSMEKPAPVTPQQESTHRLLDNEIIMEPFRPDAGKLKDGSKMPLVVTREWTNHYWAVLTDMAYPGTNLAARQGRPMGPLHPRETADEAMAVRKRILKSFPRDDSGRLTLTERESGVVDAFEEHMRREIVGRKRVAGETRRMWGFSRDQIKEALVVLKVSRQRRIQWLVSAGERLEDWGLPEFAHPFYELQRYVNITIASPKGGEAPLDPASVEAFSEDELSKRFLAEEEYLWKKTAVLSSFLGRANRFDAIFYVGGHGPMFDLANDADSIALISEFYEKGKIIAAVCHGPAALINVTLPNGEHLLQDQPVTGFSNVEEDTVEASAAMPFMLESELDKCSGGKYEKARVPFGACVAVGRDGRLLTGQNPASATPIGRELAKQLGVLRD
ncbi:hypothetical protein Dda_7966 [Drechslerella dactyloides]|uniref:D-lactate dehydratase n=1 Tax=Drechslerella dactyloides TaxID=74499 RepID=A0AAD6NF36_DREDA|nr:hypothetical protein Dda_7966 [Drechslerella dactyloides]